MHQPLVILLCSMAALRGWTPSDVVCSSQTSETSTDNTRRLCSNDSSCIHYGDCCFDADVASNKASRKETRCVPLLDHKSVLRKVVMVTRCNDSWPEDEVRKGCEDAGAKNETFHRIPATSSSGYTYSNGFCALCNYDSESWVFWSTSSVDSKQATFDLQGGLSEEKLALLHCNPELQRYMRKVNSSEFMEAESMCKLYLEPVLLKQTGKTYKNVFCALCDEVNLTSLVCHPAERGSVRYHAKARDSAFKHISVKKLTVNATSCAAWFDGKCYINDTTYKYKGSANNTTADESYTYTYQHYLIMICIGLSLFFLIMKGITYAIFRASRNFASRCNLCLSATLFFTQLVYILAGYLDVSPRRLCGVLRYPALRVRCNFRLDHAWGIPFLFVTACCALNWGVPWSPYSPAYGQYYCFFGKYRPYVAFFLVPMGALLAVDMGLYAHIVIYVRQTKDFQERQGL
ncbi:hypothetical protein MRX96_004717 [Rhipicephalus microplus]